MKSIEVKFNIFAQFKSIINHSEKYAQYSKTFEAEG